MNAKLCKILRKKAKEVLNGHKPTTYIRNSETGAIEVASDCTRGVYRHMKKAIKDGIRFNAVALTK